MKKPGRAALAKARALYDEGAMPLAKIAATLGLSPARFLALRKAEQWPARGTAPPVAAPDQADEQIDTLALERRLVRALRREIARAETEIEKNAHPGAERKARILGLLVKTLGDLRRLGQADKPGTISRTSASKASESESEAEPPRDMATLRDALVARLGRLRGDGTTE